jgi:hypothetical protein
VIHSCRPCISFQPLWSRTPTKDPESGLCGLRSQSRLNCIFAMGGLQVCLSSAKLLEQGVAVDPIVPSSFDLPCPDSLHIKISSAKLQ